MNHAVVEGDFRFVVAIDAAADVERLVVIDLCSGDRDSAADINAASHFGGQIVAYYAAIDRAGVLVAMNTAARLCGVIRDLSCADCDRVRCNSSATARARVV